VFSATPSEATPSNSNDINSRTNIMTNIAAALFGPFVRRRRRALMLELDDHLLADIGLSRADLHRKNWSQQTTGTRS